MKNALRPFLLTVLFLLAFAFSAIAGDKQPGSHHLNCPVNASAGKSAKVHTTHIRKKGKPKKQHVAKKNASKQKSSNASKQKTAKVKKEKVAKAPKQKTAKVKKEKSRDIQQQQKAPKTKAARPKNTNKSRSYQKGRSRGKQRAVSY